MNWTYWLRVGDAGDYESFDDLETLIGYLNDLNVGRVVRWIASGPGIGFETPNYHGFDFISLYWGDDEYSCPLLSSERLRVEAGLQEVYI